MEKIPTDTSVEKKEEFSYSMMEQYIQKFHGSLINIKDTSDGISYKKALSSSIHLDEKSYEKALSSLDNQGRKETMEPYLDFFYKNIEKKERYSYSILEQYLQNFHDSLTHTTFPLELVIKQMNIISEGKTEFLKNRVAALAKEYFFKRRKLLLYPEYEKELQNTHDKLHYLFSFFHIRGELEGYIKEKKKYPNIVDILSDRAFLEFSNTDDGIKESSLAKKKENLQFIRGNLDSIADLEKFLKKINISRINDFRQQLMDLNITTRSDFGHLLKKEEMILNRYSDLSFVKTKLQGLIS